MVPQVYGLLVDRRLSHHISARYEQLSNESNPTHILAALSYDGLAIYGTVNICLAHQLPLLESGAPQQLGHPGAAEHGDAIALERSGRHHGCDPSFDNANCRPLVRRASSPRKRFGTKVKPPSICSTTRLS